MKPVGRKRWVVSGGHIPLRSTGREPEFTSFDRLSILNVSDQTAEIDITLYYSDQAPVGPYHLKIDARRVRKFRFNDLIDPEAVLLDRDYGALIESSVPVVVQFTRQSTAQAANGLLGTMAFPLD